MPSSAKRFLPGPSNSSRLTPIAAALALGLVDAAIRQSDAIGAALAGATLRAAVTAGLFFGLWAAYRRLRGRDGIGLGDVKLAGVAGAWLDWPSIPIAVEIAALAALAVCLVRWLGFGRTVSATTRLPFGLFLAPAIWIAWLGERMAPQIFSVRTSASAWLGRRHGCCSTTFRRFRSL
jgi:leader peptidase (prepilin peptidase) / N-methyltransferase